MIDELGFFTIPVDIRTGLHELGFAMSPTKLNIWIGYGWMPSCAADAYAKLKAPCL